MQTPVVANYGWQSAEATAAARYITPAILDTLQRLGCRRVLDVGCGNGALCRALTQAGFDATGCDADTNGIALARASGGAFVQCGVYDDPALVGARDFDAIVATEVIEHLFAPRALPRFARALLKPGGSLLITTPYHGYWKNLALSVAGAWDRHHDPRWDGGHIKFFSRASLSQLLDDEGMRVTHFAGLGRVPWLWKSMLVSAVARC